MVPRPQKRDLGHPAGFGGEDMKVFLSWSEENSKQVAEALRDWLQSVIQALEPWFSPDDIEKGARWSPEIAKELGLSKAGIVCVTPDNQGSSWLNFEAGAISNATGASRVCTFLVGMKPSDIKGPLSQFQATLADKADTWRLVGSLNKLLEKNALSETKLEQAFTAFWPSFEATLGKLVSEVLAKRPAKPSRPEREIIEETLGIVREMRNEQSALAYSLMQTNRTYPTMYNSLLASGTDTPSNMITLLDLMSTQPARRPSTLINTIPDTNSHITVQPAEDLAPFYDDKADEEKT